MFAVGNGHGDAFLEQSIDLAVGGFQTHRRAVAGQFIDGGLNRFRRQLAIQFAQCRLQALHQHHLALGLAAECSARAKSFFQRRHRLPAERAEWPDSGLLDELVLGLGVGCHVPDFDKTCKRLRKSAGA